MDIKVMIKPVRVIATVLPATRRFALLMRLLPVELRPTVLLSRYFKPTRASKMSRARKIYTLKVKIRVKMPTAVQLPK